MKEVEWFLGTLNDHPMDEQRWFLILLSPHCCQVAGGNYSSGSETVHFLLSDLQLRASTPHYNNR